MQLQTIEAKYNPILETISRATGVSAQGVREAVLRAYSLNDEANHDRVRKVLCKVARGEKLTVAGLGGSITQGVAAKSYANGRGNNAREFTEALGGEKCWFDRTVDWFRDTFPETEVTGINAGIGATPSFLGTFRLEQMVLRHQPDLVFVEFSVNDPSTFPNLLENEIFEAYESIVRRCLEAGVAVIQVFLNDRDNNGLQNIHSRIARHYRVPNISYHNAVYPKGQLICDWIKLSPDEIHPNNVGHGLLGTCVGNYLDSVLADTDLQKTYPNTPIPENWLYSDTFHRVYAAYAYEFRDKADEGFRFCTDTRDCSKWNGTLVSCGAGTIRLTVPAGAKRVWVQFFYNPGAFETDMDGQQTVCNTTPVGWPRPMWHRIYTGKPLEKDTELTIRAHRSGEVIILGLLAAL